MGGLLGLCLQMGGRGLLVPHGVTPSAGVWGSGGRGTWWSWGTWGDLAQAHKGLEDLERGEWFWKGDMGLKFSKKLKIIKPIKSSVLQILGICV